MLTILSVFAIFIPALILPGPDFIAVVRSSITRGARAGLATTLGVSCGLGLYASLSLIGLSAILVQYHWLAIAVRLAGGAYLIWLGIGLLRAKREEAQEMAQAMNARWRPSGNPLLFGFLVTLTNPKAIVLFTSVFATAVTGATPVGTMAAMVGLVVIASLTWYTIVALTMSSAPVVRRFTQLRHWIERVAGTVFIALGGKILADARSPLAN